MKVTMTACDSASCKEADVPEIAEGKKYVPPYGWLVADCFFVGTGPSVKVEVCCLECLEPALHEAVGRAEEER